MVTPIDASLTARSPYVRRCSRSALDADDHAHNLSHWEQHYDQFSAGHFLGRLTEIWLPGLQVFQECANQALHQSCAAWPDAVWFGLPTPHPQTARLDAQPVAAQSLLFRPGGHEFELHTPENYRIFGIVIQQDLIRDALEDIGAAGPSAYDTVQLSPAHYQALLQTVCQALSDTASTQMTLDQAEALRESILDQLCTALLHSTQPLQHPNASRLRRNRQVVERARELVLTQGNQRLSIADICRQLHISRRSLQYSFQTVVGLSPLIYLRTLKLNQVRRRLHNTPNVAGRVTQIATNCGFEHLGQFSQDYRRLFGESPSTTLRHPTT